MRSAGITLAILLGLASQPSCAGDAAVATRKILESGALAAGETSLAAQSAAHLEDQEARFGLGLVRFTRAIEAYGQSQYRYGLRSPKTVNLPFFRFPVPENPAPQTLDYESQRMVLKALLANLVEVEATLAPLTRPDLKIRLDLQQIKLDLRADGRKDDSGKLSNIARGLGMSAADPADKAEPFEIAFDSSDALWLRGYCHLLAASLEFVLAYDWHESFEAGAGLFYPKISPAPLRDAARARPADRADMWSDAPQFGDLIAMIHLIRWPLAEPQRLTVAYQHLRQVTSISRLTWKSILAETDDDHEWIPAPNQKNGVLKEMPVTREQVSEWLAALDDFDAALDGKLLIPYWRFAQGINLRRVFLEPRPFDLVLWVTGHAAVPYLEAGPVMRDEIWRKRQQIFQGNFPGYAAWFN